MWPPTGVALAALLLGGLRLWPGVALGVLVTVGFDVHPIPLPILLPPGAVAAMVVGNTLDAVLGASLVRRFAPGAGRLDRVREVVVLLVFPIAVGATLSASFGVAALSAIGAVPLGEAPDTWWTWWVGNWLGVVVVAPFVLVWGLGLPPPVERVRALELLALAVAFVVIAAYAAFGMFPSMPRATREAYLLFPWLVWAALRFGPRGAATGVFLVSLVALASRAALFGPFAQADLSGSILRLQVFLGVMSATILLLAASAAERARAYRAVAELNAHLEELVQARTSELQASNADLESFAFKVSHDLRAPLRTVNTFVTELQEEHSRDLGPEGRALLARVSAGAARMGQLMDALLQFARVGQNGVHVRDVDVHALVSGLVEELGLGDAEPQVIVGALPPARAEPAMVRQVFANLLENAIKFTRGRPEGRVWVGHEARDGAGAYFVRDNGVGFDMADAGRLFRVFSRLHGAQFEGTGIGLAIVHRIVTQHGGRMWVDAAPSRGATFWFTLGPPAPDQK